MRCRGVIALLAAATSIVGCGAEEPEQAGAPPTREGLEILPPTTSDARVVGSMVDVPDAVYVETSDGVVLPDPAVTPGAVFDDVDESAMCNFHYSQGVRQPRFNDKVAAFATYGASIHERDVYRVDHLVPITLGGTNAVENLWPQPWDPAPGAAEKDALEQQLRGLVCSGTLTLAEAQAAIAQDWWAAYDRYMGLPILPGTEGPEPWREPEPAPGEVVNGGPCAAEGEIGFTIPKNVPLTCQRTSFGDLQWSKRY